jgi:hypothetical protein
VYVSNPADLELPKHYTVWTPEYSLFLVPTLDRFVASILDNYQRRVSTIYVAHRGLIGVGAKKKKGSKSGCTGR